MHMLFMPVKTGNKLKTIRIQLVNIVRVMAALWLVVHFILTMIYVYPDNPIKDTLQPLLDATIGRYFAQGWALFAPEPDNTDVVLLVRPLSSNEYSVVRTKGLPSDGWYDLSSPLWTKLQNNRFSAYGRLSRVVSKAVYSYFYTIHSQMIFLPPSKRLRIKKLFILIMMCLRVSRSSLCWNPHQYSVKILDKRMPDMLH